jgi:hypothetical protein
MGLRPLATPAEKTTDPDPAGPDESGSRQGRWQQTTELFILAVTVGGFLISIVIGRNRLF